MDRRALLTAVATGTAAHTGCAQLAGGPTRLAVLERASDDETVLYNLGVDDTYSYTVDLQGSRRYDPTAPGRVTLSVTPADAYRTTALRLALRAPAGAPPGTTPASIAAEAPTGSVPTLTVGQDDDGYAVIAADEVADRGTNTLSLAARVHPRAPVTAVDCRVETRLRGGGGRYVGRVETRRAMRTDDR